MRIKLVKSVTAVAAGGLAVCAFAIAAPAAMAAAGAPDAATAVSSRVDRVKDALSGLVTDKTITQAQADKVAETLGSSDLGRGGGPGGRGGHGGMRGLDTAATALGLSQDELRTALEGGKTLADVAKTENVDVAKLISTLVEAEKKHIAEEVTEGDLTQAQADERLTGLQARVTERVNSTRPTRPGAPTGSQPAPSAPAPATTATATPTE